MRLRVASLALLALVSAACADRTSLLVSVTSPLVVPDDVDQLEIVVRGEATGAIVDRRFELMTTWPHSLSLRPGAMESGAVTITVTGRRRSGAEPIGRFVVRRVVRAAFAPGMQSVVEVVLPADCVGVECADGVDCVGGRCQGLPADGGVPDASRDGGADAGCTGREFACDDGVNCTVDTCVGGACMHAVDESVCADGTMCDPLTGCPPRTCTMDAECDDGRPCNGVESCSAEMTCVAGVPIDCDDLDACTRDVCDDGMRGACVRSTRDDDGDGHGAIGCAPLGGVPADDCDDSNADVLPGAPEICNGLDDDCEGGCDEEFTCCRGASGACMTSCGTTGSRTCTATCSWSICSPPAEECNAIDDDCNGAADDVFACVRGATEACTTSCGSAGTRTCSDGCEWSDCAAPDETCNGRDDDCDGRADEGFGCVGGTSAPCATSCGSTGQRACDATCTASPTCTPPGEGCNGVDDDCDGRVDETVECSAGSSGACTTSCGSTGTRSCSAMCMWNACTPPAEVCNGGDDDCDGRVDETFTCVPGATGTCATGCATTGMRTCSATCTWGMCTPPVEACNGRDDDCDMMCDETFACCAGTTGSCMTSCGTTGMRTCSAACGWSACSPPPEVCNGVDDDCNGACDDGAGACCAGRTGSCTTSCGSTGSRLCSAACAWGACAPPVEACGGGDDDCDGMIDEGFACSPGASGPCTTTCMTMGTRTCGAACAWNACSPPAEACNTVDDDCDGMIDEGCGTCVACTGALAVTGSGGRYTSTLQPGVHAGSCGGMGGSEYTLSFTTTEVSDVMISTHGASIDTVLYVRACGCTGTEVGCNDNADGRTSSRLQLTGLAPGTYQVFVDTKAAMSSALTVDLYISAAGVLGDRCGHADFIAPGTTMLSGNTCMLANDYDLTPVTGTTNCPFAGAGDSAERVHAFYLPAPAVVGFNGCTAATTYDSAIYIRSVCNDASAAAQLGCNDDNCPGAATCGAGYRSARSQMLPAGLYYFFIDGYNDATTTCPCGPYTFNVTGI